MKNVLSSLSIWGFILAVFLLAAMPVRAQNVDEKIQALEQELANLKSQQIELKKEATAAAAALPSFSYRPGNGVNIEAADKSWALRFSLESHFRMLFESGQDAIGRTNGEVMLRRFRPYFFYCIDNCLYELEVGLDLDGFGTGNAKNSTNTGGGSILHRGALHVHLEHLNPWLPTFTVGGDVSTAFNQSRQGSSAVGSQAEYDLLTRTVPDDGSAGWGYVFDWDDRSLNSIGVPGKIGRFELAMAAIKAGDDNLSVFTDRKSFSTYLSVNPFSDLKNKWLQGMLFEMGAWFCNIDDRAGTPGSFTQNACDRIQIQDLGNAARQTLFDTGANSIGKGLLTMLAPGFSWEIGPYRLRTMGAFTQAADGDRTGCNTGPACSPNQRGKKRAHDFLIGHDLFLWSPKGFLTGSANTAGSVLVGTHFERTDASCDPPRCNPNINGGQFHRGHYVLREWDLYYFLAPRMSIGGSVLWYNASNLTTTVQQNLGCSARGSPGVRGAGCQWTDANLNFRYQF
jgi:hypothetical protein